MREEQRRKARSFFGISGFTELVAVIEGVKPGMRPWATGEEAAEISELASELKLFFDESVYAVEEGIATGESSIHYGDCRDGWRRDTGDSFTLMVMVSRFVS